MLPKPLIEDICSLRVDVERITFSVIWEMTPEAEIISTRFSKSVIKSCAALSYVEAQARMDDSRLMDPLTTDLRNMNVLAKVMRQRRIDRGALTLASTEVKFQVDTETHDPLDIVMSIWGDENNEDDEDIWLYDANETINGGSLDNAKCKLLNWDGTKVVVAEGTIASTDSKALAMKHGYAKMEAVAVLDTGTRRRHIRDTTSGVSP
ncbi:exosome complex exonuclease RRP44 homolog A-like [Camellia sinensis]|uniref:exosome complex exonuclease RRP44 homolog A-like n=1 Tax=Camellia sinensis TaxID=4442 RepID=UPI0010368105|nr:exosome complex exonuclease RRP44 homolog A-like [Camellia sinensis]